MNKTHRQTDATERITNRIRGWSLNIAVISIVCHFSVDTE